MKAPLQTQKASTSTSSFAPARKGVLQRECACGGAPGPTGECTGCRRKRMPGQGRLPGQTKLTVGRPGDLFEREADRVASQVMQMPPVMGAGSPTFGRQSPSILQRMGQSVGQWISRQVNEENQEEELTRNDLFSMKEKPGGGHEMSGELQAQIQSLHGGGQSLNQGLRAFYEPRFGHDFSQVRIHSDARAAQTARSLNARAYTLGQDIAFASGEYRPHTPEGRELIAHELTHVIQQRGQVQTVMRACDCSTGGRSPTAGEESLIQGNFPSMVSGEWCVIGNSTPTYNCIAWSISDTTQWIWNQVDGYGDGDGTVSISDFDAFYDQTQSLSPTIAPSSNTIVALYAKGSVPQHAALTSVISPSCGTVPFTSKLGEAPLIAHDLNQLEGGAYGNIVRYYG